MPRQTLYSFWGNLSVIEFLDQLSGRFDFVMFSRAEGRELISGRIEKLAKLFENSDRHTEKEKRNIMGATYTLTHLLICEKG